MTPVDEGPGKREWSSPKLVRLNSGESAGTPYGDIATGETGATGTMTTNKYPAGVEGTVPGGMYAGPGGGAGAS